MKDFAKGFRSWTVIDLDNYSYNVNQFREIIDPGTDIMQIVKADAYGHGSVEIAREAENLGIKWLGVANSDEGVLLRLENISAKILILSPSLISEIDDIIKYNLIPSVSRFDFIEKLDKYLGKMNKRIPVHINFDTGMGRAGFLWKDAPEVLTKINEYDNIFVQGAFSHFSQSEEADDKFTKTQYKRFEKIKDAIKSAKLRPKYYHISNSAAVVNYPQYSMDMVRLGLASYGVYTDKNLKEKINLKPVLKFCSKISLIKEVPANYSISYNRTFVTKKPTKFALVPIGYGDGYNYLLSNKGKVIIKNSYCPIIGKVTMDMLVVDVSELPEVQVGDEVLLLGESGTKSVRAEELADRYDGLSYELLCALGRRAKRVYIKKEKQ
ncbi:MAG: alanine racemase, partial [Candidatus Cloacimonetes bacterium]|nr:alanine racemase [Candidatus Cloacimonadota bacterium]